MKTESSKSKQQQGPESQSQGCWLGIFVTNSNLFCEMNASGQKPNLASLAKEEPSGGVWLGTFCRQKTNQGRSGDNERGGNKKKNGQKKSNMVCDGGGWLRSEKQRTSFLLVIQDEIIKSPTKNEIKAIENGGGGGGGDDTKITTIKLKKTNSNNKKSNSGSSRKALKAIGNGNDTVASYSTSRAIVVKPMSNSNIRKLSSKLSSKTTTTKSSSNTLTNNDTKKVIKRASRSGSSMLSSDDRIES